MAKKLMLPTSVRLPPKLKERLRKQADAEHRTLSNLIEKILIEHCDAQDGKRKS